MQPNHSSTLPQHPATAPRRHLACPGCCSCLPQPLPITAAPVRTATWLLAEPDELGFYTAADHFVVEVVHARRWRAEERVEAAREFARVHGLRTLVEALEAAGDELPAELLAPLEQSRRELGLRRGAA